MITPEAQTQPVRTESAEKPLAGKVFVLTGASRGIGAVTAVELAKLGAVVIGPHREDTTKKIARADSTIAEVEQAGGKMISPITDMTKPEDRAKLIHQIKTDFGQIDGIIYNHAGGMEADLMTKNPDYPNQVNAYSKLFFFREAAEAGIFKDEIVVIDQPSNWSKFFFSGIKQMKEYFPVAESKKLGEQLLRQATREYNETNQAKDKRVRFGMVCGHAIDKTATVQELKMCDRARFKEAIATAKDGVLPQKIDMSRAIVNMAMGNFRNEDTVFVGSPQITEAKMPTALPMYSPETRYIDYLLKYDSTRAFGFYKIREKDVVSHFLGDDYASLLLDEDQGNFQVTESYTKGHFTPEFGISILPGHKIVAAAFEISQFNKDFTSKPPLYYRLNGVKNIEFKVPVLPEDRLFFIPNNADFSVKIGNTEVASIKGLEFKPEGPEKFPIMTPDRFIEAAAQTLGVAYLHGKDIRDILPLFGGVKGPVEYQKDVYPGQLLEMEAVLTGEDGRKQFSGDVIFRVDDEIVAKVFGIDCRLFPRQGLGRAIRMARRVLEQ